MALKTFNPTSAGRRHMVMVDRSQLWKGKPVKTLTEGLTKSGGRGNSGRITSRRKGGGHKQAYRLVDFQRSKINVAANADKAALEKAAMADSRIAELTAGKQVKQVIAVPGRMVNIVIKG